jgi:hypothetical protein
MRLTHSALALTAAASTGVTAIQNIFLGQIAGSPCTGIQPTWYAWFSDADPCTGRTSIGPRGYGFYSICQYDDITIQGHDKITFTRCNPSAGGNAIPTSVSDDGVPALTCNTVPLVQTICPFNPPCGLNGAENTSTVQQTIVYS